MRPVTEGILMGIAGASATVIGLFLVGVFFYVERGPTGPGRAALRPYMRAGVRIVMLLFALALFLPLAIALLPVGWAVAVYVVLTAVLVAANVETALRLRRVSGGRTLVLNEIGGTVGVLLIVVLPWMLGRGWPGREELTLVAVLALAAGFLSVSAMALSAFDAAATDDPAPARDPEPTGER